LKFSSTQCRQIIPKNAYTFSTNMRKSIQKTLIWECMRGTVWLTWRSTEKFISSQLRKSAA
jgi:hypothetical protein